MIVNDAYLPLIADNTRHLVLYGGADSGKSVFAAQKLIMRVKSEKPHTFICLRKTANKVRESCYREVIRVINDNNYHREFRIYDLSIKHINGNRLIFTGLDDANQIKSYTGLTGMWLEEAEQFTADDLDQVDLRIRGEQKNPVQYIYTFNPVDENLPIRKKLLNGRTDVKVMFTTYKDNLFATEEDKRILESYKESNPLYYDIYCLGKWGIVDKSNKFLYSFSDDTHVKPVKDYVNFPLWVSFDFNKDPMTCIVAQRIDTKTLTVKYAFKLNQGSTPELCDMIISKFPDRMFIMTGDATGRNRSALVRGNLNHWVYIKQFFNLTDAQLRVRSVNISHINSRILCNTVLQNTRLEIDPDCKELIEQCKFAKVDEYGDLVKDRQENKNDFLDCFRYLIDANYPEYIAKLHKHN